MKKQTATGALENRVLVRACVRDRGLSGQPGSLPGPTGREVNVSPGVCLQLDESLQSKI